MDKIRVNTYIGRMKILDEKDNLTQQYRHDILIRIPDSEIARMYWKEKDGGDIIKNFNESKNISEQLHALSIIIGKIEKAEALDS